MNKPRMIQVLDPELSAIGVWNEALDAPVLWLNTRAKTYWADADELRAWRSAQADTEAKP